MCITYCNRRNALYWNHEDCSPLACPFAAEAHGRCERCRHRQGAVCGLTRAPLPAAGGCCHYNVDVVRGVQVVTLAMLEPLGVTAEESVADVLDRLDAPYRVNEAQRVTVDPDELGIPTRIYGVGTEETALPAESSLAEAMSPVDWDWNWE